MKHKRRRTPKKSFSRYALGELASFGRLAFDETVDVTDRALRIAVNGDPPSKSKR